MWMWVSTNPGSNETSPRSWTSDVSPASDGNVGLRPDGFDAAVDHEDGAIGQPAVQRRFGHPGREEESPVRHDVSCTGRSPTG